MFGIHNITGAHFVLRFYLNPQARKKHFVAILCSSPLFDSSQPNECSHPPWFLHTRVSVQNYVHFSAGTSLTLAPSGRHAVAGFTDGTIRLFDLTGRLWSPSRSASGGDLYDEDSDDDSDDDGIQGDASPTRGHRRSNSGPAVDDEMRNLFDHDSDDDEDGEGADRSGSRTGPSSPGTAGPASAARGRVASVCSKSNVQFGAVAAQIHAKGVITSLLMDVSIAQDGLYAFGGVLRGSMELVAIDLGNVEAYHDMVSAQSGGRETRDGSDAAAAGGIGTSGVDMLDLVSVYRHSDAKLKGFGACTRVRKDGEVEYRLFTGKGIKVRDGLV